MGKPWWRSPGGIVVILVTVALCWKLRERDVGEWTSRVQMQVVGEENLLQVPQIIWGLNNQKIAIARAALTARYLNRSLVMPTLSASLFHNSTHPAISIPFSSVFSLPGFNSRCEGFVRISHLPPGLDSQAVRVTKGSGRRWTHARDLEHLNALKIENGQDKLLLIDGKNPFLWPDHWEIKDYVKIFQCMVLTETIMSDVHFVSSRLNSSYAAVHMRIENDWMIHCKNTENRALQKDGKKLSICTSKSEIIQRVSRIKSLNNRVVPVYLAVADVLLLDESSVLDGWGGGLIPFEKKKLGVFETYAKHPYLVQAAMDYEICSRADVFVGNSFSTFSSLVVLERSLRHPDSCNISFAYNMVNKDGSARPWRADLSKRFLSEISYESDDVNCSD